MEQFVDGHVLADVFRTQARAQPQATAQIFRDRVTSYAELDRRTNRVANGLITLGGRPGTRIGYLGKNSDLYFELLLGTLKANVVLVPVNWRLAPPEAAAILADAGVDILFVSPGYAPMVRAVEAVGHAASKHIAMDGASPAWPDFAMWRDAQPDADPMLPIAPNDTAMQLYTSGTTGLPKGVELTNRNFLAFLTDYRNGGLSGIGSADVVLTCMPVFHVAGTNVGIIALAHGCTNVVLEEASVPRVIEAIHRHGVTFALLVPAVILALVQHPDAARADFHSVRRLMLRRLADRRRHGAAGQGAVAGRRVVAGLWFDREQRHRHHPRTRIPGRTRLQGSAPVARPYPGVEVQVVDPFGNTLPAAEVGEIVIRAPAVMKGYWNNPEATRAAFFEGGWLRTGDAGYFDADGFLYIHDRIKDMIISGGGEHLSG